MHGSLGQIRDPVTELLVSAASAWEIGTKFRLGKLDEAQAVVHGYAVISSGWVPLSFPSRPTMHSPPACSTGITATRSTG